MIEPKDLLRCGAHTMTWNQTPTCEGWKEYYLPLTPDPEAHLGMDLSIPYLTLTVDAPGPKGRPEQMVTLRVPPTIIELPHITTLDDFLEMYRLLSGTTLSTKIKIGACGVDAGMLMVGDPRYFIGNDASINKVCQNWSQACDEVFCLPGTTRDTPMDVYGLGVAIGTTHGDGVYPVYLKTTASGERQLIVELQ